MLIKLKDGMKFKHIGVSDNNFIVKKYDYYSDHEPIWCAFTGMVIYPLSEICLDDYIPQIDGRRINEKNRYIF